MGERLAHVHGRLHGSFGGSALRDDGRRGFALAHAGAASHAERNDRCEQRNCEFLHWYPLKSVSFNTGILGTESLRGLVQKSHCKKLSRRPSATEQGKPEVGSISDPWRAVDAWL
jgi:hypothetical protein